MSEQLEGINSVMEALRSGRKIERIYVDRTRQDRRMEAVLALAAEKGIPVETVDRARLKSVSITGATQGIVATAVSYRYYLVEDIIDSAASKGEAPFIIILDGIEDPQNLGSIIRTAECAGVHGVIIPQRHSAKITPAVGRASAGAVEHVKVSLVPNLVNTIKYLKRVGLWVVGSDPAAGDVYFDVNFPTPLALVVGGEGRGIRRLVRENCDMVVRIPMFGRVGSLNASVACALVVYEVIRQHGNGRKLE